MRGTRSGRVLLDFSNVDYINSTGIAVIVGLLAMARAEGRDVGAFGLTDHYREVFQITRLADFMTIYDDEIRCSVSGSLRRGNRANDELDHDSSRCE